jgi:hypothetical protein
LIIVLCTMSSKAFICASSSIRESMSNNCNKRQIQIRFSVLYIKIMLKKKSETSGQWTKWWKIFPHAHIYKLTKWNSYSAKWRNTVLTRENTKFCASLQKRYRETARVFFPRMWSVTIYCIFHTASSFHSGKKYGCCNIFPAALTVCARQETNPG